MSHSTSYYTKQFTSSLYWNSIDSIASQAVLLFHYFLLSTYTSAQFYAQSATIFSFFYLAIIIINGGFSSALASFFETFTQNRYTLSLLYKYHLVPQLAITGLLSFAFYYGYYFYYCTALYASFSLSSSLGALIALTFFSESVKKIFKSFLQYALYFKITSIIEFIGTVSYVSLIWLFYYFYAFGLTLEYLWTMLLIVSLAQTALLGYYNLLYYYSLPLYCPADSLHETYRLPKKDKKYKELQKHGITFELPSYRRFSTTRFFVLINQLSAQIFTTNVLMPLCTFYLGASQAQIVHISSNFARWITLIAQKGFGISALAIFAQTKYTDSLSKQQIFSLLNKRLYQVFYGFLIFITLNLNKLIYPSLADSLPHSNLATHYFTFSFLLIISLLESFFVLYEKWYIVEEKAYYNFLLNSASFLAIYSITSFFGSSLSLISFFLFVIVVRLSAFVVLSFISFYTWNLKPIINISYKLLLIYFLIALSFRFLYF